MKTIRRSALAIMPAVLLAVLIAMPVRAADDVLNAIPEGSLGFVTVNQLAAADDKLVQLGQKMQLPVPRLLGMLKLSTGLEKGLNEKGSAAMVLMPAENADALPVQILLVPVTDFGQFVGQFQPDDADAELVELTVLDNAFLVGRRGRYAVFAEPKHRDVLQNVLDAPRRVPEDAKPMQPWLGENDVAAFITRRGVELLAAKGQEGLQQIRAELEKAPAELKKDMEAALAVFGIYEDLLKAIGNEVTAYGIGLRIDDGGAVWLADWARLNPKGRLAKVLADVGPPERDLLAGLPAGPFVVVAAGVLPEELGKAMIDLSIDIMKAAPQMYGLDEQQVARLAELSAGSMAGVRGMSMMLGVGELGQPLYDNMAFTMTVDDTEDYLARYRKTIERFNQLVAGVEQSILKTTELSDVEIDGRPALKISMEFPITPELEQLPGYDEIMKKMFGPDGKMTTYMAAVDDHTIVASYTRAELLRQSLAVIKGDKPGLTTDEQLAKTAAVLPAGAQWVGYWSPQGTIDLINRAIPAFVPPAEAAFQLPAFPATPPIGLAAKTVPGGVRGYLVVPAEVIRGIGELVAKVKQL